MTSGEHRKNSRGRQVGRVALRFASRHGAPIIFAGLLWWVLWWGHTPALQSVDDAMHHVSWVGVIALVYVALQARAVLVQPRGGVVHSLRKEADLFDQAAIELVKLQKHVIAAGKKLLIIVVGRDGARKDGLIKRVTKRMGDACGCPWRAE